MRQLPAAPNRAVRASTASTATRSPDLHHDAPPDIQRPDLFPHIPAVPDVFPFFCWVSASSTYRPQRECLQPERGFTNLNAFLLNFLGDLAKNVVILEMNQFIARAKARKSGRTVENTCVFLMPPSMTARWTPSPFRAQLISRTARSWIQ